MKGLNSGGTFLQNQSDIFFYFSFDCFHCQILTTVSATHAVMVDRVWMVSATTHVTANQGIQVVIVKEVSSRSSKFN